MAKVNENYLKLRGSYLFSTIAKKVSEYQNSHPEEAKEIIRLGIGDVTKPLTPAVLKALHSAVDEMGNSETFRGYAPDLGYDFLRKAIADEYKERGCDIDPGEIFVSDGAKSDTGNIQEIFSEDSIVAICDPVYPVYADSNVMAGRSGSFDEKNDRWDRIVYMPCTRENGFSPELPEKVPDIIYLCSPNNPTGTALNKAELKKWVDFALEHNSVILFDAAYEAYITEDGIPRSIYEIEGAKKCAVEFRSFSKNAGFTGVRLGFTVVPQDLEISGVKLNPLWARRHGTKYNGAPYIQQRAGEAVFSPEGKKETKALVDFYLGNARIIYDGLKAAGYEVYGGVNSPYIWLRTPNDMTSWDFFEKLLNEYRIVGTPGSGFGPSGEHYFRLTAFGTRENAEKAVERLKKG
ncbi:MAG: LL-diaminopimelate aminotransferase [Lachnospiraceae bacterium]|nr:LL-diaminopimelate aminotransferase [Lachnospiraceae bacterium]